MTTLKGTQTEKNILTAFAGESQARNKYTFFAEVARQEGYHYIAKIFEETAENEKQHAMDHLKLLNGIGDTAANLKEAFGGEDYEVESMYPGFAKVAEEEKGQPRAYFGCCKYQCVVSWILVAGRFVFWQWAKYLNHSVFT